jgi:hypothetical protein
MDYMSTGCRQDGLTTIRQEEAMKVIGKCVIAASLASLASGCASSYSDLVSGSQLGAMDYRPAVLPMPGMEAKYQEVLAICRQVAVNRQVTAAQEAQLRTITGVGAGALEGAAMGIQMGSMFKQAGVDTSINRSAGIGLIVGSLASLGSSFQGGANRAAASTKDTLLTCLRRADPNEQYYKVIES